MQTTFNKSGFRLLFLSIIGLLCVVNSCKKDELIKPTVNNVDPGSAAVNTTLTLTGSGLRDIISIVFDLGNVPVSFNPNFNTDNAIVFRVPANANSGDQNIIFKNKAGFQFQIPFKVLPLAVVSSAFPLEWEAGNNITLTGSYFESVDDVALETGGEKATIVSKTATTLVIKMPTATASTSKLVIHNNAGSGTTNLIFTNLDKQVKLFTEDFGSSIENWSWSEASKSSDVAASGTSSLKSIYDNNEGLSFRRADPFVASQFQSLSFWLKGGTKELMLSIKTDANSTGAPAKEVNNIAVPANVWTYFNIPMAGNFDGANCQRLNFQVGGITGKETLYFDNVVLVK